MIVMFVRVCSTFMERPSIFSFTVFLCRNLGGGGGLAPHLYFWEGSIFGDFICINLSGDKNTLKPAVALAYSSPVSPVRLPDAGVD